MFSIVGFCLMASSLFISFAIKPTEARCSQTREFTILNSNNHGERCTRCPICPPGKGLAVQCGSKVKNGTFLGCENCENETYSDANDTSHCKPCNQCGFRIIHRKCTSRQNSNCSMTSCIHGYYMHHVLDLCLPLPVKIHTTLVSVLKKKSLTEPTEIPVSYNESLGTSGPSSKNLKNSTTTARSKPTKSSTVHHSKDNSKVGVMILITGGCLLVIAFLIYLVLFIGKKMKQFPLYWRKHCCLDPEGAEGGEEIPLTECETDDHLDSKLSNASATLREFRERHPTIFESICLQMDHHNNWKALGLSISIPDETLQQIATSTSCAKTVFDIIEKKNPRLTVKEMRDVLKEMLREDVCKVLEKYLLDSHTVVNLRENINCSEEVAILLDKETPGMKNWLHFARKLGVSKEDCDNLKPKGNPSPTKALVEHIVQVDPGLKVKTFIEALVKMQRIDVVNALGKFI